MYFTLRKTITHAQKLIRGSMFDQHIKQQLRSTPVIANVSIYLPSRFIPRCALLFFPSISTSMQG